MYPKGDVDFLKSYLNFFIYLLFYNRHVLIFVILKTGNFKIASKKKACYSTMEKSCSVPILGSYVAASDYEAPPRSHRFLLHLYPQHKNSAQK